MTISARNGRWIRRRHKAAEVDCWGKRAQRWVATTAVVESTEVIKRRRMVRAFTDEPLAPGVTESLLSCDSAALDSVSA